MNVGFCIYSADSRASVAHYLNAFGASLGYNVTNDDGTYFHAEIVRDGQTIFAVSHSEVWAKSGLSVQCCLNFGNENKAALEHAYSVLSQGGHVLSALGPCDWNACMADVVDKFGVRWYIAL